MAHKRETTEEKNKSSYTVGDAIKIADEIFKLSKDNKYNLGAFIHGLIFAQEYAIHSFKIPQQQVAIIKRDCRKYFQQIKTTEKK